MLIIYNMYMHAIAFFQTNHAHVTSKCKGHNNLT